MIALPFALQIVVLRDTATGTEREILVSKELHHINGRQIDNPHAIDNLVEVWPWEHAATDPSRHVGYVFVRFK